MNLGWKLAAVVRGRSDPDLLDTYHAERHPWAADVAEHTLAQTALITATSPTGQALRRLFSDLVGTLPDLELLLARRLAGLDVRYPDPGVHPLVGTRVATTGNALLDGRPAVLPVPGTTTAVIRPDGYVGWATDADGAPTPTDLPNHLRETETAGAAENTGTAGAAGAAEAAG
jgi:hypothetical protein